MQNRNEMPDEVKWNTADIYPNEEIWQKDLESIKTICDGIASYKGSIMANPRHLRDVLLKEEALSILIEKTYVYAHLKLHEDSRDTYYQGLADKAATLSIQISAALSFIAPEILESTEETALAYIHESEDTKKYVHYIKNLFRLKKFTLSKEMEEVLKNAEEMAAAPKNIFSMLNDADIKFSNVKNSAGEEIEITKGNFVTLMMHPDRNLRRDAYHSFYESYESHKNTLAQIYAQSVKKDAFYAKTRGYASSLQMYLSDDNIAPSVYLNLIETVNEHIASMHKYMAYRKKALHVEKLSPWDLYVPFIPEMDKKISYGEAQDIVIEALAPLGEGYINVLKKGFSSRWIDVYENQGKRSGAYAWGAYGSHPFVLMNWEENLHSVFTLAHEMGHALHSYYSDQAQEYIYAGHKIFVAEVASTVNEVLLIEHLLKTSTNAKEKNYLINYYLEQFRGTVFRQTLFAEFEKATHAHVENHIPLTVDTLCDLYTDLNKTYYGTDLDIDEKLSVEWARIPHFYSPFYVYQYATGFSAACALAKKIIETGSNETYLTFLKSGSSDYSIDLLKNAGVDMTHKSPVEKAMKIFEELVDELV